MYQRYFDLADAPFSIAPDPRYLFLSEKHREALAHLLYGVGDQGGFVLLTGEVGTGKTTLCRSLLQQIPEHTDVAYIINPRQSINQLLQSICDELHIEYHSGRTSRDLVDDLNRFLLEAHASGRNTLLIIDEAQNLGVDVLEQLRLLTNLETNEKKLLQLVLLGQPELNDLLAKPQLRQLAQRVTARFHLGPLSKSEVKQYIAHRLSVAGCRKTLFSSAAVAAVYRSSRGIPRLINQLCDRSLLGVYATNGDTVTRAIAKTSSREVFAQSSGTTRWRPVYIALLISAALLLLSFGWRSSQAQRSIEPAAGGNVLNPSNAVGYRFQTVPANISIADGQFVLEWAVTRAAYDEPLTDGCISTASS